MLDTSIRSDAIRWQTVDKKLDVRTVSNESLSHNAIKRRKKIKKRTKLLNRELKKFASLKSYSQYVRVKTAILRAISDNDDTEDEELPSSPLSPPLSPLLSLNNSKEESNFDVSSESLPFLADEPSILPSRKIKSAQTRRKNENSKQSNLSRKSTRLRNNKMFVGEEKFSDSIDDTHSGDEPSILPSRKIKSAQTRRKDKNSKQSNLSRKSTRLRNNKMFVGEEKFSDSIDDTHSGEQGGKNEKNIGKLRGCSGARRNLTSLLESLDDPIASIKEAQRTEKVASGNSDDADNNGDNKKNNRNNFDHNNRKSQRNEIKNSREIVEMTNLLPGDSGIDDDSQDNLSINNRAKDIIVHDEQRRDNHQDLELRGEASSSRVDEDDAQMVVDVDNDEISKIRAEKEQEQGIVTDEMRPKKLQPTITCTELVKSKYMIIRGENKEEGRRERNDFFQASSSYHQIIHDEEITKENIEEITEENIEEITKENIEEIIEEKAEEIMEEKAEEIIEENAEEIIEENAEENIEEITQENMEEIIEEKIEENIEKITQENAEEIIEEDNEAIIEMDRMSPETRRVSQMKRLNLICSGTESDSSQDDEIFVKRAPHSQSRIEMFGSQVISDPSDSDESVESFEMSQHIDTVHSGSSSVLSLPLEISNSNTKYTQRDSPPIIRSEKKSIKSQIEEQQTDDDNSPIVERKKNNLQEKLNVPQVMAATTPSSSRRSSINETINEQIGGPHENLAEYHDNMITKMKERSIVSSTIRPMPTDAESLQYVLNNLCTRSNNKMDPLLSPNGLFNDNNDNNNDNTRDKNGSERDQHPDETLSSRPIELTDFVTRQGLIPTRELSTITIDDVINCTEHDEDDEIWLMEIPRMIANDPKLCGKSISLEKESMIIGETRYEIIKRHEKSVSCILRTGSKKKARYKTVNVRPVGSIVVRHESAETGPSGVSKKKHHRKTNMAAIADAGKIVPFPKNLKSRDPLSAQQQNFANDDKKMASPSNKTRRKTKTQRGKIWHVDNFILKSKRKKVFP